MNKPPVIKPGDDLWQWAARSSDLPPAPAVPDVSATERGILSRLWLSLRGMLTHSEPSRHRRSPHGRR